MLKTEKFNNVTPYERGKIEEKYKSSIGRYNALKKRDEQVSKTLTHADIEEAEINIEYSREKNPRGRMNVRYTDGREETITAHVTGYGYDLLTELVRELLNKCKGAVAMAYRATIENFERIDEIEVRQFQKEPIFEKTKYEFQEYLERTLSYMGLNHKWEKGREKEWWDTITIKRIKQNTYKEFLEQEAEKIIGAETFEIKKKLGYWWVLESQNIPTDGSKAEYRFKRAGRGSMTVYTENGIVMSTETSIS